MKPKTDAQLAGIIEGGRAKYVLFHGVLGWGLICPTLVAGYTCLEQGFLSKRDFFMPFIGFPITGIFWGMLMWYGLKNRFDKEQQSGE